MVSIDPETRPAEPEPPVEEPVQDTPPKRGGNMLPSRGRRRLGIERFFVRLIATVGVVGVGVILGAILVSNHTQGWVVGLAVSLVTVVLSAILWSSRQL